MSLSIEKVNSNLTSVNTVVKDYDKVENAANNAKETYTNVKQTAVGQKANDIVGGVKSLSSKTDVLGATNFSPTEGLLTKSAVPGAISDAMDTTSFLSTPGVSIVLSYSDSGYVDSLTTEPQSSGSISSILSIITGLGVSSGFLQNVVSGANAKGLTSSLNSLKGKVGAFANVSAVNNLAAGAQNTINQVFSSAQSAIPPGDTISSGFLTSFSNEGSNSIADVANIITSGASVSVENVVAAATGVKDPNLLPQVRNYKNTRAGVVNEANKFSSTLSRVVPSNDLGFLQNLALKVNPGGLASVFALNGVSLSKEKQAEVAALAQGSPNEREKAIKILKEEGGISSAQASKLLLDVDTTIAGTIVVDKTNSVFSNPFNIGENEGVWDNGVGSSEYKFSFVSSVEELEAEFKKINREITEMVVHWTETYSNANIGSEEINENHIGLGMGGIGYHYVIRRDGSVQRGRPSGVEGDHTSVNNHNKRSIGIAFVGGLNCPSGTPNPTEYRSVSSLTRSQFTSFYEICKAFYLAYPGGQIVGHNDLDLTQDDPGFDVIDYCEAAFGKISLFEKPDEQEPLKPAEINGNEFLLLL